MCGAQVDTATTAESPRPTETTAAMLNAFTTGVAGKALGADERAFLRDARPAGLILFARNIETPAQVRRLVHDARDAIGEEILVLIDQEGGRVRRLRPPHWREIPEAARYRRLAGSNLAPAATAARLVAQLTAAELRDLGITCNCAPVLDLPVAGSHEVIGSRAYGADVATVVDLGRAVIQGTMAGGVLPVVKHIPGHGRATADSHLALPNVTASRQDLEATDFAPFRALADCPAAMTAHVVYSAIDAEAPASTSARVHREIIRGHIGFDGLLMSDDLSMQALAASGLTARTAAVLAAGTDLALHCSGIPSEMTEVATGSRALDGRARERFDAALAVTRTVTPFDVAEAEACLAQVVSAGSIAA